MGGNSHSTMGNSFNLKLAKEAWQRSFCMVVLKEEVGNEMSGTYEISQQHIIILKKQQEVKVFG
jgi:hypothetical protein